MIPATPFPEDPPLSLADQLLFDLREIDEINLIAESFGASATAAERERLRFLAAGTDDPDNEEAGRSRDAQFELYLRSALKRGGGEIILGDPDLLVVHERGPIPIEAKRPTSLPRLDDRLREAANKLSGQPTLGIAAISLDHVIRPSGGILGIPTAERIGDALLALVDEFLEENIELLAGRIRGKKLAGLLLVFRTPARARDTNLSQIGTRFHLDGAVDPQGPDSWILTAISELIQRSEV